ncbi:MAG: putative sulfate exporter family transporter [Candidatus Hydrogenedens sp.]|nr:putative sulfate exporter family transporter [Candidatus Hydrogenedens sp.]
MSKDPGAVVTTERTQWSDLYKKEDWWAIWLGAALLATVFCGMVATVPGMPKWTWGDFSAIFPTELALPLLVLAVGLGVLFTVAAAVMKPADAAKFLPAFLLLFALTIPVLILSSEKTVKAYGIGYPFWAVGLGLLIANTLRTPEWLKPALRTEFYVKTGLVIMGAEILFNNILKFGAYGLAIAWGVTPIVIIFMWFFGTRFLKMVNKPLVIVVATSTSVCGVSAAIAAAAASRAKREDLTLAVGMTLIFTVFMMIGMPVLCSALGLPPVLGGAWIGGVVDATGAVVAAGESLGPEAGAAAAIVKMIQNLLIGVVAFFIALHWVTSVERDPSNQRAVGVGEIWTRFPKFILGFVGASLLVSFVLVPMMGEGPVKDLFGQTKEFREWLFALAFLSIGLESNFSELGKQLVGGKPIILYVVGQSFNIVLTLFVAWLVLSSGIFPAPPSLAP